MPKPKYYFPSPVPELKDEMDCKDCEGLRRWIVGVTATQTENFLRLWQEVDRLKRYVLILRLSFTILGISVMLLAGSSLMRRMG